MQKEIIIFCVHHRWNSWFEVVSLKNYYDNVNSIQAQLSESRCAVSLSVFVCVNLLFLLFNSYWMRTFFVASVCVWVCGAPLLLLHFMSKIMINSQFDTWYLCLYFRIFFYCWNHSQVIESPLFTRARLHSQTLDWCCSVSMSRSPLSPIVIEIILFHILKTRNDNKTNMKSNQNSKFTIRICMPEMYRIKTNSKYTRNE